MGLPPGTLAWTGPFDPESDEDWLTFQAGGMKETEYWSRRCEEFSELTGEPASMPNFMAHLYAGTVDELTRPEARQLIADAKAAGVPIGLLTNDLRSFHDQDWVDNMTILGEFDYMVEGRTDGVMKPDARAYELIIERMGVTAEECVFIDDQPINLEGARSVGMHAVYLDPVDPESGFAQARALLGV
jgi:putative hydrolase of the HAD superfamily